MLKTSCGLQWPCKQQNQFQQHNSFLRYNQNTVQSLPKPWMHIESRGLAPLTRLTSELGDQWSASRPGRCTPTTHSTGSWVDPRASLEGSGEEKFLALAGTGNPDQTAPHYQKEERHSVPSDRHACILFDRNRAKTSAGNRLSWEN
jgi:hypothetical protein